VKVALLRQAKKRSLIKEKIMFKLITLGACLVGVTALIGAGTASARAGGTSAPLVGAVNGVQSADSGLNVSASLLPTIWSSSTILSGQDGDYKDHSGDKDHDWDKGHDKDHDKDKRHVQNGAPSPTPEPSTILTFGAALAIGGGVLFLGRLRKERK
jgi:hypothetical protein